MCDTFVVLPEYSADGSIIFGKNSDRDVNEPHYVEIIPAQNHETGSIVECTYVAIPQVAKTNRVLLCRPVWIWGAEMGVNEHGVVIGNEAIFSKVKAGQEPGLIGMDYLRLGLERGNSALEALQVISSLLETYGQSGNCGFSHPFYYHNSYLIADRKEAWKLETIDHQWAAQKIEGYGTISNCLTIETDWDLSSSNLVSFAEDLGYTKKHLPFNFAEVYSDWLYTRFSNAQNRKNCTATQIQAKKSKFELRDAFSALRSHHGLGERFDPAKPSLSSDVCMHAGFGPIRVSQTTGSLVTSSRNNQEDIWITASSAPCLSVFKPVRMTQDHLFDFVPEKVYEGDSYWWQHEILHRRFLFDYRGWIEPYCESRSLLEEKFISLISHEMEPDQIDQVWQEVKSKSEDFLFEWTNKLLHGPKKGKNPFYQSAWEKFNRDAEIGLS